MIHLVFNRSIEKIKVFTPGGLLFANYRGEGDAWSDGFGFDGVMPPGHYLLATPQWFDKPIASEGWGQIPVLDLDAATERELVAAGKAEIVVDDLLNIGGIQACTGELAVYKRSDLMLHGGGSNAPDPYSDYQQLCKTEGCTRMFNAEWKQLAAWLESNRQGNTVVFTAIGDPVKLPS